MPQSPDFRYDVFLSHNTGDKPQVRRLAERRKDAGLRVWFDDWAVKAGDIIALKVDEGLEQSRVLLLCISPAALASGWVALERSTAVHRDPANAGRRFIPLLLGDCDLPDTLRRYKYVDFREESEAAFAEVLATCRPESESLPPTPQPDVARDRRYVWPECAKPVTDLDAVRKRLEAKKDFIYCQGCDAKVALIDFIEQRLKSDPVARKILAMDETATRQLDTQALEQILIGHMMAIAGEANQIFRPVTMFDYGIDSEVEFKGNDSRASGKKIYVQLKSGNSCLRTRQGDGREVFDVKNERHLDYWISQPVDVYLVIRQKDETSGQEIIRWMNVTRYHKNRKDKKSRQVIFEGEKLDMEAVWKIRDAFFPPLRAKARNG